MTSKANQINEFKKTLKEAGYSDRVVSEMVQKNFSEVAAHAQEIVECDCGGTLYRCYGDWNNSECSC
jgi:hypothetical protein